MTLIGLRGCAGRSASLLFKAFVALAGLSMPLHIYCYIKHNKAQTIKGALFQPLPPNLYLSTYESIIHHIEEIEVYGNSALHKPPRADSVTLVEMKAIIWSTNRTEKERTYKPCRQQN